MSFIDLHDFLQALTFIVENKLNGITNIVSPNLVTQREIKEAVSEHYKLHVNVKIPNFLLKMIFGKGYYFLLSSPKAFPERLIKLGFTFKYKTFNESVIRNIHNLEPY